MREENKIVRSENAQKNNAKDMENDISLKNHVKNKYKNKKI